MSLNLKTRNGNGIFLILIILMLSNCTKKETQNQWDKASINPNISKELVFKQLDKQKEIFSGLDNKDSLGKRTSDVSYFSGKKINLNDAKYSKFNNCRAYYFFNDTLSINIGFSNGFTGRGFIIKYKNKKFYTEGYYSTDVIIEGEIKPTHKIVYQKLTLDKTNYKVGDSLFGKIEFKSIEKNNNNEETTEHFGKGYFRTKVSKF